MKMRNYAMLCLWWWMEIC